MGSAETIWGGQRRSICCVANIGNVNVASAGQIWWFRHHGCARMGVVSERVLVRSKGGVRKSVHGGDVDRVKWLTTIF
jgi:hypothetical protein